MLFSHGEDMKDYLKLAQVLKPQGIRGEVKLKPFVDELARFLDLTHVYVKERGQFVKKEVSHNRVYKQFAYLKLEGVEDRNAAEQMRGAFLYIDRASAAPLPEGAAYIADLLGLPVCTRDGRELGVLAEVLETGGVDVYMVEGERRFSFPAAPHIVLARDVEKGRIIVDDARLHEVAVYD